jgi:signal transduction histidine kinase
VVDVTRYLRFSAASASRLLVRSWLWGWAAIGQLIMDLLLGLLYLFVPIIALVGIVTVPIFLIGLPLLVPALYAATWIGHLERARVLALTGVSIPATPGPTGPRTITQRLLLDGRRWRALLHVSLLSVWGPVAGTTITFLAGLGLAGATVPLYAFALPESGLHLPFGGQIKGFWWMLLVFGLGLIVLLIVPLLARLLVQVDVVLARLLLGPSRNEQVERLSERVDTLTLTREATVDSVETERRRIERDLHDGPQQRLVAIAMDLGMAQERIDRDPVGARALLDKAHSASKEAITEMRMVARGIHPPILTDRGLDAALSALAARSPVPVTVDVDLPGRASPTVEAISYFCVSEALTNVAKHARATSAQVTVRAAGPGLVIVIRDDGGGGADPALGTGLHGLADRVRAIDGTLAVDSPLGGPTVLTVTLPARLPWSPT